MDDTNRLMHPGGQSLMHQPYGLPPVNVGVGLNMSSFDQGNQETENMTGRKQVTCIYTIHVLVEISKFQNLVGHW